MRSWRDRCAHAPCCGSVRFDVIATCTKELTQSGRLCLCFAFSGACSVCVCVCVCVCVQRLDFSVCSLRKIGDTMLCKFRADCGQFPRLLLLNTAACSGNATLETPALVVCCGNACCSVVESVQAPDLSSAKRNQTESDFDNLWGSKFAKADEIW